MTSSFFTGISAFANPKVVVIGAGLAGLTTAYRLQKAGMDVDLYEARERVGGRVLTVRLDGHIAELGGQSIADGGEAINIRSLIDEFGLELTESRVYLEHAYFDGKNLTPIKELTRSREFDPETLRNQLNQLVSISTNMKELLDEFIGEEDPLYKVIAVRLAAYEGASLEKLSPFYAETLFHMLLGGISFAHQWSKEEEGYVNLVSIKGGNALLPEKIASTLDTRLHLGMPLKGIAKAADGSFALTFQNEQEIRADILVLAIPCPVYEEIVFADHVIPPDRLKAIKSIKYGANAKILVPFSRIPSQKSGLINDQIISFFDAAESILTIYYTDATSLFSEETILNSYLQARPMLELGYGNDCPVFTTPIFAKDQNFKAYNTPIGYSWPNDPYARGSYSYIASGQEALLTLVEEKGEKFKVLFKPVEQTLFFVGEHASILLGVPGTMEAACESGERIARAILEMKEN